MSEVRLWVNRIVCGIICALCVWICEKYNLRPVWCFLFAFATLVSSTFVFEIIKIVMGE